MAKSRSFIIGGGGHAHVIASFLDGEVRYAVEEPAGADEISQSDFFRDIDRYRHDSIYIGIGDNAERRRMYDRLKGLGATVATCVAPNAFVARDVRIGEGAVVCAGAVIGSRAVIGPNTIVNTLSSVDHDCVLGEDSQVTAGVTLGGTVKVGRNCFFGIKSAVIPNRTIGDDVAVMAGSLIVHDVPGGVLVGGNPARVIRTLAKERGEGL